MTFKYPAPGNATDKILFVSKTGNDSNDGLSPGQAKLTVKAALEALPTGGEVRIGSGTFAELSWTAAVAAMSSTANITIKGNGGSTRIEFATPNSVLLEATKNFVNFEKLDLVLTATATNSILVKLVNSFRWTFRRVTFRGQHISRTSETYRTQIGIYMTANSGDSRFTECDIYNLGRGVLTDTTPGYFTGCNWGQCYYSIEVNDNNGAQINGSIGLLNCSVLGSSANATEVHFYAPNTSGHSWLQNVWFEGCQKTIVLGNDSGDGPNGIGIINCKVAAVQTGIEIKGARQVYLQNITFSPDLPEILWPNGVVDISSVVPLSIHPTNAITGFAANLILGFTPAGYPSPADIPASVFPSWWTYIPRGTTSPAKIGSSAGLQVNSIQLGHATDTTISRSAAGKVSIEGAEVVTTSGPQTLIEKTLMAPIINGPLINTIYSSAGNLGMTIANTTSAVNYPVIRSSAAGSPVRIDAAGEETNVSLNLTSKGSTGKVQVNGAEASRRTVQTVTAATTLGANGDYVVFISGANGAVTLPTAVGNTGRYTLKNIHTENKTVSTTSSQTIDGGTLTILPGDSVDVISDGTNWRIV